MRYFKITFKDGNTTDSMGFAAEDEKGAFTQLEEMCGPMPRNLITCKAITEDDYKEMTGEE